MATTEHSDLEQQIIKTAQQLFIEKGFVETSMSDIAATVGINRPTLHYYFRTKDKMFKAVFGSIVMSLMPNTGYSKTGYPIYGATKHDSG